MSGTIYEIHFLFNCMMYNQESKSLCLGIGKTFVNQDKTLVLKFVMEHCPQKLAKLSLECIIYET